MSKKLKRVSIDNYFHFCGLSVYLSGNDGIQIIVKGWIPRRCRCIANTSAPIVFDYESLNEAYIDYANLVKELINYVQSSR